MDGNPYVPFFLMISLFYELTLNRYCLVLEKKVMIFIEVFSVGIVYSSQFDYCTVTL